MRQGGGETTFNAEIDGGDDMGLRVGLIAAIGLLLTGCGMIDCAGASQNTSAGGGCSAHTTFLR